jgi:regulator of cell morphogenesis and NO signaling
MQIRDLFTGCSAELSAHMKKEEEILFPYIREMAAVHSGKDKAPFASFGTVGNPIRMMMQEHDAEGARFREIVALSNNYTAPDDACGTYRVTFALLQEFEDDLHLHIHLENNILFPKSIELEAQLKEYEAEPAH